MHLFRTSVVILLAFCAVRSSAMAEELLSLEAYVKQCVVIVKARTVLAEGAKREFEITETWMGDLSILPLNAQRRYFEEQGTHGIDVTIGQEIVFFFTRHNQPATGKLRGHSTAFPITDGRLAYGRTAPPVGARQMFAVADFKKRVLEIIKQ